MDSHQFQGRFLRLLLMEMNSLNVGSLQVYKKDKVRLQDVEHMNRLRLRCDRSIGRNDWSLLGAHVCSAIEACKQAGWQACEGNATSLVYTTCWCVLPVSERMCDVSLYG